MVPLPNMKEMLVGDSERYKQVLINLMQNSVKFTSEGEICITLEYLEDNKNECLDCGTLRTTVKDTGVGIEEEELKNIFEMFT